MVNSHINPTSHRFDSIAVLLPGYLDSGDYLHMVMIEEALTKLGYSVKRLDPCGLWRKKKSLGNYTVTNYLSEVRMAIDKLKNKIKNPRDILVVGHSLGALVAIVAGSKFKDIKTIISLCPPVDLKRLGIKGDWKEKGERTSQRDLPENFSKQRSFSVPYTFIEDGLQYSALASVQSIKQPLMIFIADKDTDVPPSESMRVVEAARKPYVVRQKELDHDFRRSKKETKIVVDHIINFLKKQ
jgi:esterase/lipase